MQYRLMILGILASATTLNAQQNLLANSENWTIQGRGQFVQENGENILQIAGGGADLNNLVFENGTISFEVKLTANPSYVGMYFRSGETNAEHVYIRPHRSGLWDSMQYQAIMNNQSTWQLSRGEGFTGAVDLPHDEWIPVRIEVQGDQAEFYVGDPAEPSMTIRLESGMESGSVSFYGGFRGGQGPTGASAGQFRRLTIQTNSSMTGGMSHASMSGGMSGNSMSPSMRDSEPPSRTFIGNWRVSAPFALSELPATTIPDEALTGDALVTMVDVDRRGLVNLTRHFSKLPNVFRSAVAAEVVIDSREAVRVPLEFDYSDDVSVFLNGELIFSGTNTWQSKYPFYLGTISPTVLLNSVILNLRPGANWLTMLVSEKSFGWGFIASMERPDGVTVR